ncbi:MAG TPA: M1 family aminopeptidase [Streptosporangiaceae bacterium]|nr:M1 family aminopeptidase [Streptosporangiaceae bacterium]
MAGRASLIAVVTTVGLAVPGLAVTLPAVAAAHPHHCSAGAHTLSPPGASVYPETGNGGYTSMHTLVHLVYDAFTNRFLPGNSVSLTDRAVQCLSSFSLDFERKSGNKRAGPDMTVQSVTVDGQPASFRFVQPTYPGDPNGQDDPNPAAHEASQTDPVGGPQHNPLPPACSPELTSSSPNSLNGTQCPANKLVITPARPIREDSVFTVTVSYTGKPGVHNDGDGTTEGWFRAPDGSFVTTEPVATEDWMPLNDFPAAKPTYTFSDTVNAGKTVIANGELVSVTHHKANSLFPHGSVTWNWRSRAPIASYLVEDSVGNYHLTQRTADNGVTFYQAQDTTIKAKQQKKNLAVMQLQQNITEFESQFNGTYPFTSDGIVIGTPSVSFDEEMQTMIAFAGGQIDPDTLYHENMHQWWGDNVTEAGYNLTFYKEGLATLAEFLFSARQAEAKAGGPYSTKGQAAFQAALVAIFNGIYGSGKKFWTGAPSNPEPFTLFNGDFTYARPGIAYIALRQILGHGNFTQALQQAQRIYGGRSITEAEFEAVFHRWLPVNSAACQSRLSQFFTEWFDTPYPQGGGKNRPQLTGPGLAGPGFYGHGGCSSAAAQPGPSTAAHSPRITLPRSEG